MYVYKIYLPTLYIGNLSSTFMILAKSPQLLGALPEALKVGTQEICDELQLLIARYLPKTGKKMDENYLF